MSAATSTPTRRWALTKVEAGDYLLPSNERTVVWRLMRSGDHYIDENDREVWRVQWELYAYWRAAPVDGTPAEVEEFGRRLTADVVDDDLDPYRWRNVAQCDTRAECIDEAMRFGEQVPS